MRLLSAASLGCVALALVTSTCGGSTTTTGGNSGASGVGGTGASSGAGGTGTSSGVGGTGATSGTSRTGASGGSGAGRDAGGATGRDAGSSNPCAAGTCRFRSNPTGQCLPPGGPVSYPDSGPSLSGCCTCGNDGFCSAECLCASPDTPIATPTGDRPIASLSVGDLVLSIDDGRVVWVPIRETHRTFVTNHRVIEVVLSDGASLRISAAHPTADGRFFGQLHAGDWLGGEQVAAVKVVPYAHDATYDILPDSDTGTYFAGGALIGSTLVSSRPYTRALPQACVSHPSSPRPEREWAPAGRF